MHTMHNSNNSQLTDDSVIRVDTLNLKTNGTPQEICDLSLKLIKIGLACIKDVKPERLIEMSRWYAGKRNSSNIIRMRVDHKVTGKNAAECLYDNDKRIEAVLLLMILNPSFFSFQFLIASWFASNASNSSCKELYANIMKIIGQRNPVELGKSDRRMAKSVTDGMLYIICEKSMTHYMLSQLIVMREFSEFKSVTEQLKKFTPMFETKNDCIPFDLVEYPEQNDLKSATEFFKHVKYDLYKQDMNTQKIYCSVMIYKGYIERFECVQPWPAHVGECLNREFIKAASEVFKTPEYKEIATSDHPNSHQYVEIKRFLKHHKISFQNESFEKVVDTFYNTEIQPFMFVKLLLSMNVSTLFTYEHFNVFIKILRSDKIDEYVKNDISRFIANYMRSLSNYKDSDLTKFDKRNSGSELSHDFIHLICDIHELKYDEMINDIQKSKISNKDDVIKAYFKM